MIDGMVKTKTFPTKQEAKKWEALQSVGAWQEKLSKTPSVSFHSVATEYLLWVTERFSKATFNEKRLAFKALFKAVQPDTPPEEITTAMGFDAMRTVAREKSGNAANVARKNLVAAWSWGRKYRGLPSFNPFKDIDQFPADQKPRYVPPEEDFWSAYNAASSEDQVFLLFMLHTGARRSEVFRLRWEDIDLDKRCVRLGTRKTTHGGMEYAWVSLTSALYSALLNHKIKSRSKYVFTDGVTGEPYKSRQHFMERLCRRAGVKPFGFHAIRHLTASLVAHDGVDIPTVQAILRHKNPNTTARYIRSLGVVPDTLERVFSKKEKTPKVGASEVRKKAFGT